MKSNLPFLGLAGVDHVLVFILAQDEGGVGGLGIGAQDLSPARHRGVVQAVFRLGF